jgi:signal recognition particle receptor subunit beta
MPSTNAAAREIHCKVVYYGPGLGGKTTNLEVIHRRTAPETRGQLVSLAAPQERALFFDFLPVDIGEVRGVQTRFHLYSVPGQVVHNATRRSILTGVDAIVFVADSDRERLDANIESMQNLHDNLAAHGLELAQLPFVIQYNKRDLSRAMPIPELEAVLNPVVASAGGERRAPSQEAVARTGVGVFETLKVVGERIVRELIP